MEGRKKKGIEEREIRRTEDNKRETKMRREEKKKRDRERDTIKEKKAK